MRLEFKKQVNVFEILPAITVYKGFGGEYRIGTITLAWLKWAVVFTIS